MSGHALESADSGAALLPSRKEHGAPRHGNDKAWRPGLQHLLLQVQHHGILLEHSVVPLLLLQARYRLARSDHLLRVGLAGGMGGLATWQAGGQ